MTGVAQRPWDNETELEPPPRDRSASARVTSLRLAAAEAASAGVALCGDSPDTAALSWVSAAAVSLLGTGADELLGWQLPTLTGRDDDDRGWAATALRLFQAADEPAWTDATATLPDGRVRDIQVRVSSVVGAGWLVLLRRHPEADKHTAEAEREWEHRFRSLAEHAPVGIVLSDAGVRLGYVNDRFAEIAGLPRASLLGTRWLDTIHPEDLPALLETIDEVLSGAPSDITVRLLSVTDSQRWVQLRLSPVTTPRRAAGFIGTIEDITARRAWESQLAYQAGHDSLTGLANRRRFVEALTQLLISRRVRDRDVAVLFCDLDGFKQVNDTLGHDAGDRVLIEVGQRLSTTARDHDLVARIAGDEFVVLIREIGGVEDAEAAAGRQIEALTAPIRVAGTSVTVSASIGVALARDYDDATSLLKAADRGMYEAKRTGCGMYRVTPTSDLDTGPGWL